MTVSRLSALFLVMLMLAGCGGRAVLGLEPENVIKSSAAVPAPLVDDKTGPKAIIPVFVATSRERSGDLSLPYTSKRSPSLNFARVDIGIPPNHKNGEVEKSNSKPNPARHFAATTFQPLDNRQIFIDRINAELARRPAEKREIFIFVHGYNNNFADSVFRQAQIAYDYALPAVAVHYSWPSAAALGLYVYDRDSATYGREGLAELLQLLTKAKASRVLARWPFDGLVCRHGSAHQACRDRSSRCAPSFVRRDACSTRYRRRRISVASGGHRQITKTVCRPCFACGPRIERIGPHHWRPCARRRWLQHPHAAETRHSGFGRFVPRWRVARRLRQLSNAHGNVPQRAAVAANPPRR